MRKTLINTDADGASKNVSDLKIWGDGDTFKLISKASSQKQGWMKSTKAMEIEGVGCVVQVTTQQGENVAEAITFVPGVKISAEATADGEIVSRQIVKAGVNMEESANSERLLGHEAIKNERIRQHQEEGFSVARDVAEYKGKGHLVQAAQCYAKLAELQAMNSPDADSLLHRAPEGKLYWPWDKTGWKPSHDPKINLEKAGALLAAQWDVFDELENRD